MKNALRVLTFIAMVFLFSIVNAQETRTPITAENATQLTPQYTIGSALPGKLAFSPDGRRIAIGTSEQTFVYDALELDVDPPVVFTFSDFEFNAAGELIAEGKRWNMRTGMSTGVAAAIHVHPPTTEQPNTVVEVVKPGGETIKIDTGFPYPVVATAVNEDYRLAAVAMRPDHPLYGEPTVYLYALPSGRLTAAFPQVSPVLRNLFFVAGSTLISDFWQPQAASGAVSVYNATYGIPEYAQSYSTAGVRRSPDGKTVLFEADQGMLVVLGEGLHRQFPYSPETNPNPDEYDYYPPPHALGNRHIGIATHGFIEIFDLQGAAEPSRVPLDDADTIYGFSFVDNDRKLLISASPPRILDLEQPGAQPIELNVDGGYFQSINDDATRYTVGLDDGKLSIRDVESGETLAELPNGAVVNSSYSQAVYWEGGRAVVHNLITDRSTEFEIIGGYLGKVVGIHAPTGVGVFAGQTVVLADLETNTVETIDVPFVPDGVDFNEDGSVMLMNRQFQDTPREHPALAIWDIESETAVSFEGGDGLWHISRIGKYITSAFDSCRWYEDGGPSGTLHHADVSKFHLFRPLLYVSGGCLDNVFGYAPNDEIVYTSSFSGLYAISSERLNAATETLNLESPLLSYTTGDRYNFDIIMGVVVSPDGSLIALSLQRESLDESAPPVGYRTEIFSIDSLQTRVRRVDVIPLLTIDGATTATFSPDSAFVATNAGAFSVKNRKLLNTDATISAFTTDSRFLATYESGSIVLWNIAEAYSNPYPLAQYEVADVRELGFSSDGTSLYVVRDGDIQVWQVDER
jgi:WD40 repeat protein